jgi:hypothetical protein
MEMRIALRRAVCALAVCGPDRRRSGCREAIRKLNSGVSGRRSFNRRFG